MENQLLESIEGTNLMSSLKESRLRLQQQADLLDIIRTHFPSESSPLIPENHFNLDSLLWARGHYLARRYPATFIHEGGKASSSLSVTREKGFQSRGCLVPLLDILNHNHDHEWLTFEISADFLRVICNHPVKKVPYVQKILACETSLSAACSGL